MLVDVITEVRRCLHQHLGPQKEPGPNLPLHLMQVCGRVCECTSSPRTLHHTERLIEAEPSLLGNIKHAAGDQTTNHLTLPLPGARGAPASRLARPGWHVKPGCMARQRFVVYHRVELQVWGLEQTQWVCM